MKKLILMIFMGHFSIAFSAEFYSQSLSDYSVQGKATWKPLEARRNYIQYELAKKIIEGPRKLNFKYTFYRARRKRSGQLLILFPTISGVTLLEKTMARYFVNRGMDVVIPVSLVRDFKFNQETVKAMDEGFWRSVIQTGSILKDLRRVKKYNETFVVGASQGGTRAAMLLGQNLEIDKAYTFVAGGDFAKVFALSDVGKVEKFRENHMRALGLKSKKAYEAYLGKNLAFSPEKYCALRKSKLKMLIATKDTSVPTSSQYSLWRGCGHPVKKEISSGHILGVLSMYWYRGDIYSYFKK
jgi:hypothetical protein